MVGTFPPPLHGMSAVNRAVHEKLLSVNAEVEIINLSTGSLNRSYFIRIKKLWYLIKGLWRFVCLVLRVQKVNIYMALSGGYGQLFELPFLLLSKIFSCQITLHHHSFAYIEKRFLVSRLLFFVAGKNTQHIVLCDAMGNKLKQAYPVVSNINVLSNAAFINSTPHQLPHKLNGNNFNIGFLSNISKEKGIYTFIDVVKYLKKANDISYFGIVVGPFQDVQTETEVKAHLMDLPHITYIGTRYGTEKQAFLDNIHVLLFPTEYFNEAEPLTILEAMANGIPVIAISRGCIACMLPEASKAVFYTKNDFIKNASLIIEKLANDQDLYNAARSEALNKFLSIKRKADAGFEKLCRHLSS